MIAPEHDLSFAAVLFVSDIYEQMWCAPAKAMELVDVKPGERL